MGHRLNVMIGVALDHISWRRPRSGVLGFFSSQQSYVIRGTAMTKRMTRRFGRGKEEHLYMSDYHMTKVPSNRVVGGNGNMTFHFHYGGQVHTFVLYNCRKIQTQGFFRGAVTEAFYCDHIEYL